MDDPHILLTNDDGIDSVGFRAMYDSLSSFAEVTAVAPADDQSAVGRSMSHEVEIRDHETGYVVEGTPADCTVAGLGTLCPDADLVVSGCNKGANIGAYVLGRSGTVSAAVEAAFFDVPALAVSLYIPSSEHWREQATDPDAYRNATDAASYLIRRSTEAGVFDGIDYLNVNAPMYEGERVPMEITQPSSFYDMGAERNGTTVSLRDYVWGRMRGDEIPDPEGTDRRAVFEGRVSVSPLAAPHTSTAHDGLSRVVSEYRG
ncbi:MAG: 5'/3'-nucleotidase SurE [Halobacteriota archaeon]